MTDFLMSIWAFIAYWFGWLVLIGFIIAFLSYALIFLKRALKYKDIKMIIIHIIVLLVIGFVGAYLFHSITQYGIEKDPNRYTEMQKQIRDIGD
ncbi:hypothetical protein EUA52_12335 [Staphylococcus saprophyticus]|uniref:hypothetical protein n=1 Tax=Staphylococcus saprophyticus TaxID=29385 RepID=UPI000659E8C2|nr:hypothetical protein [Staphylococcus saprophyticus]RXS11744.1 hypothetical protein EUA52_12335 [Staphylococcus saprophyticus]CRV31571.1 Uncharacterised protein [Streptococcus equi subsp. equi]